LALSFLAIPETLLSAAAVDRMHQGPRADFDRELTAQGVGNMLCGVLGALPMTGVIVRSSANVQAGARTRLSSMLHALWLLAAVVLLAALLEQIPIASLAGVLVYTGLKLIDLNALRQLGRYGRMAMLIHLATTLTIVATDLLTGVLLGFALTLGQLAWQASRLRVTVVQEGRRVELRMQGAATFLKVPRLARALEGVPKNACVHVPMTHLQYIDHACMELLEEWQRANQASGARLIIEPRALTRRVEGRRRQAVHLAAAADGN
jgi:MFS superfamily sulfate permease-like transporter